MENHLITDITIFQKSGKAYKAFEPVCFSKTTSNRLLSFTLLAFSTN